MKKIELIEKYLEYERNGYRLFTVTLSTYVKSDSVAKSDRMRQFWDNQFINRINQRMTAKLKDRFDHDWIIEESSTGHYHYHGVLAFKPEAAERIWLEDGLHKDLRADLDSFKFESDRRPFKINKFLIEPMIDGDAKRWLQYMTKDWHLAPTGSFLC